MLDLRVARQAIEVAPRTASSISRKRPTSSPAPGLVEPAGTTLPWEVLGALSETFVTAAGSLEHLDLQEGETLLLRGATSSVGLACLGLARAAGIRVIATTRSEAKGRRLTELGAAGVVLDGDGFAERARAALPEAGADDAVA